MSRLQDYYRETVVPKLRKDLALANPMQVPRITKITVNMGVGEAVDEAEVLQREFAGAQVRCHLMPQQAERRAAATDVALLSIPSGSASQGL